MSLFKQSLENHAVAARLVDLLLERGNPVSVWDSEEETVIDSTDRAEILEALATTDQDEICAGGFVFLLVWDASGDELISDYSYPLGRLAEADEIYKQANAAIEALRNKISGAARTI